MREFKESVSGKDDDGIDEVAELPPAAPSTPVAPTRDRDTVTPASGRDTAS